MITKAKSVIRGLLPKNTFARGVSVLVGGTASAQVLTILAAPLLTRLYTPENFGLLAVYASLLALIGVSLAVSATSWRFIPYNGSPCKKQTRVLLSKARPRRPVRKAKESPKCHYSREALTV